MKEEDLQEPMTPEEAKENKKRVREFYKKEAEKDAEFYGAQNEINHARIALLNSKSYTNKLLEENNELLLANTQSSLEINKTLIWIMVILILILCGVIVLAYDIQPWWK
jgi:hypothetical protein